MLDILFKDDQPQKAVPGGSTFNSIVSLGRAGVPCAMVTEAGGDHIGDIIVDFMRRNHVSDSAVTRNRGTQSHISMAFLDANNDAQYEFYKDHKHASLQADKVAIPQGFAANDLVLFGSFFAINPVLRPYTSRLLQEAHEAGAFSGR